MNTSSITASRCSAVLDMTPNVKNFYVAVNRSSGECDTGPVYPFPMTFGQRIRQLRLERQLSQEEFAEMVGVTREAVSIWEKDKSLPRRPRLDIIVEKTGADYLWLTTGEDNRQTGGLPVLGTAAAGVWIEATMLARARRIPIAPSPDYPAEAQFALVVAGNSVNRIASDGAHVHCVDIIKGMVSVRSGDVVVVERRKGDMHETTIKRLVRANGSWQLHPESDDPEFQEPTPYDDDADADIEIRAVVIGVYGAIGRGA